MTLKLFRYSAGILVVSAVVVLLLEPWILHSGSTAVRSLDHEDRVSMYSAVAPIAATLLGFLVAAVAILVQLDVDRQIVKELRRGEAFGLLIVNLLTASTLLLVLTVAALAGPFVDSSEAGSGIFEGAFEIVAWASLAELLLGGYFFGYVTIKVARFR